MSLGSRLGCLFCVLSGVVSIGLIYYFVKFVISLIAK
jgi:hypothetical protein